LKAELDALSSITPGGTVVDRIDIGNGFRWHITFANNLGDLPMMYSRAETHEIQSIITTGGDPTPIIGTFTLTFMGQTTSPIPFDATETQMQAALDGLDTIGSLDGVGSVEVHRTGPTGNGQYQWFVTFRANPGDLPNLQPDYTFLQGTDAKVTVTEVHAGNAFTFTGSNPRIVTEERLSGLPSYTGSYIPNKVGSYALAVRKLTVGGIHGDYFDNQWLQGSPVISRTDSELNFAWGNGLVTRYGRDYVSARWTGKVRAPTTEVYVLTISADEGVRLWWHHQLVVDRWDTCCNDELVTVSLQQNQFYDLRVEWKDITGNAYITLYWQTPTITKRVIP